MAGLHATTADNASLLTILKVRVRISRYLARPLTLTLALPLPLTILKSLHPDEWANLTERIDLVDRTTMHGSSSSSRRSSSRSSSSSSSSSSSRAAVPRPRTGVSLLHYIRVFPCFTIYGCFLASLYTGVSLLHYIQVFPCFTILPHATANTTTIIIAVSVPWRTSVDVLMV